MFKKLVGTLPVKVNVKVKVILVIIHFPSRSTLTSRLLSHVIFFNVTKLLNSLNFYNEHHHCWRYRKQSQKRLS